MDGVFGNFTCLLPGFALRARAYCPARVGKLALLATGNTLVDYATNGIRPTARSRAIEHHLSNRDLTNERFAAGFVIDGFGQTPQTRWTGIGESSGVHAATDVSRALWLG